jgi:hypothetical protein
MKDRYTLVTIKDGQKDCDSIMEILKNIHSGRLKNDLKLLNFIREVPVSFSATLEDVDRDRVELTVNQSQAVLMRHDKYTLIRSSHFPSGYGVHAFVALANATTCAAILVRFAYVQIRADRRNAVRVQVHAKITGTFFGPSGKVSGELIDISLGGLSIEVRGRLDAGVEETGSFSCTLPTGLLEVPARVLKIIDDDDGRRIVLVIDAQKKMETYISQFIFNEQIEIIKELKERYV